MTFNPADEYDDSKITLKVEGEYQERALEAYCSPDADGRTFIDGGEKEIGEAKDIQNDAPFPIDVIFKYNTYPMQGDMEKIRDELGTKFDAHFDKQVDGSDGIEQILGIDIDNWEVLE